MSLNYITDYNCIIYYIILSTTRRVGAHLTFLPSHLLYILLRTSLGRRPFDLQGVTQLIRLRRIFDLASTPTKGEPVHREPEKCRDDGPFSLAFDAGGFAALFCIPRGLPRGIASSLPRSFLSPGSFSLRFSLLPFARPPLEN